MSSSPFLCIWGLPRCGRAGRCPGLQSDLPTRGHLGRGGTDTGESKEMTGSQFQVVYNAFAIQWVDMIVSGLVTFIASYHY